MVTYSKSCLPTTMRNTGFLYRMLPGLLVLAMLYTSAATARSMHQGGGSIGPDTQGWIRLGNELANKRVPKHDEFYEDGKSLYLGSATSQRVQFCVAASSEAGEGARLVPVGRKSIRSLRGMEVTEFVKHLYDCENPGDYALGKFRFEDAGKVVYYLDRHYRLRLKQSSRVAKSRQHVTSSSMVASRD